MEKKNTTVSYRLGREISQRGSKGLSPIGETSPA